MPKARKKSRQRRARKLFRWAAISFLLLVVAVSTGFGVYKFWHQHIEAGQYQVSDIYLGENLRDSLDLKLAAKAAYPSGPVKIVQDFGADNDIDRQEFSFQVPDDNLTEYGLLSLPAAPRPAAGFPTLILLHGFSSPGDYRPLEFYKSDVDFYAGHGFAVFTPDLRGQGFSLHAGHEDSAYYSMVYNTDVMSLISALKKTPLVDASNINIWGHSMGAYIGLRAALLSPDIKNLILLSGPVDSLTKMYSTYIPPSDSQDPYALATRNQVFSKYHTPSRDQFWSDASPINLLPRLKANVQIHVGADDKIVPPEFSADLDKALTKDRVRHSYYVYPDGHSLLESRQEIWDRSLQLLTSS